MLSYNISSECAATSVGRANDVLLTLMHVLASAQCEISPPSMWPPDYGEAALEEGIQ